MAMFSAHFDESGAPGNTHSVLTVAGCVSSVNKWARFEVEWNKILIEAGLPEGTVFHMNKFARNIKPYEEFEGNPKRKAELISALVNCTRRNVNKAFSCTVVLEDWERMNQRYYIAEHYGYPYSICGRTCVAMVLKWSTKNAAGPVEFFLKMELRIEDS
jgi:hypothetical protein